MVPIIKPQELTAIYPDKNLVLIDARTGKDALAKYKAEHLAGALYVDLETDLAQKTADPAEGGRHPLPPIADFATLLGKLGITPESHVVVYDDKNGANAAARFWWMLRAIGHERVQVLDGGYNAAIQADIPTSSGSEKPAILSAYPHSKWLLPTATITEVEQLAQNPDYLVIDVREAARFKGETEPIDLVAGHIPGAVNIPFSTNLTGSGALLTPEELKAKYTSALGNRNPENIIVHCGSGVTACHTLLAMDYAGLGIPKLYVGSWSEWSRSDRPIATGG
ncbi:sulfurtransferase [Pontibacter sp. KCTC 32443]|uniref:sulfurtransferase n=1 Tax=Pontibacter TaxID=323449 RepID=UPI00164ED940|nr:MULTISPECIES: sulfurtransferase [Pontibacter]MBC5774991.1 sulfurtransferase [Pontibacter sp. KCTC 32443]